MSKKKTAYKVPGPWIDKVRVVKSRPQLARAAVNGAQTQTSRLTEMLKATIQSGSIRINAADLPINIKSLRTQVVQIAGKLKATSHVIVGDDKVINMWLEPRGSGARRGRKPGADEGAIVLKNQAGEVIAGDVEAPGPAPEEMGASA
jgi:hypothetical protein